MPSKTIQLRNLPDDMTEDEVKNFVCLSNPNEKIEKVSIGKGKRKGSALVTFKSEADAKEALTFDNGTLPRDPSKRISVRLHEPRQRGDEDQSRDKGGDGEGGGQPGRKIYIGNLPYDVTEADLRELFKEFVGIEEIDIPTDRRTGKGRGFAFATFTDEKSAKEALELTGSKIGDREVRISPAKEREPREPREPRERPERREPERSAEPGRAATDEPRQSSSRLAVDGVTINITINICRGGER